ncbi:MAG: threonylcarbamoyl-AMP synthase, partial [Clostridiales bacterium]|nr:threonylcarbamoyl-AMP synthase [Clostridiales bacterium]
MKTLVYDIKELNNDSLKKIDEVAMILRNGGVVAFPTETVYGLGADALNHKAVSKIFKAKGRPSDNPLIVHISDIEQCYSLTNSFTETIKKLAERFWPGPLTIIVPKSNIVPDITTGGLDTVAIRMPDHPVALELIRRSGCPVAAPSANLSGRPSPTKGEHVMEDMFGKIDAIIKSGDCKVGIESTILDLTEDAPSILRPGILTPEELSNAIGQVVKIDPAINNVVDDNFVPKAPGMKYAHYAPNAEMIIFQGERDRVIKEIERIKEEREKKGDRVGVILYNDQSYLEAAHELFAKLREFDKQN